MRPLPTYFGTCLSSVLSVRIRQLKHHCVWHCQAHPSLSSSLVCVSPSAFKPMLHITEAMLYASTAQQVIMVRVNENAT